MKYNKEIVKSDGRRLVGGGPRDMQRRQKMDSAVDEATMTSVLRGEINNLRDELSNRTTSRDVVEFTAEQVDEEINKAVKLVIRELNGKHTIVVKELESKITSFKERLDSKDMIIRELKDTLASGGQRAVAPVEDEVGSPDRPQMETVFIDPLETGAGSGLVSHITVEDVSIEEKEKMDDKVAKLRNILGKLPVNNKPKIRYNIEEE